MYEAHGWIVIQESPVDADLGNLPRIVAEIRSSADLLSDLNPRLEVVSTNGLDTLVVTAMFNHRSDSRVAGLANLVLDVCREAPGSYGLFHIWDDEDDEHADGFQVVSIRRGGVELGVDEFLSPCVPMIEDEGSGV